MGHGSFSQADWFLLSFQGALGALTRQKAAARFHPSYAANHPHRDTMEMGRNRS
jgi:hypothetical protein